MSVWNFCFLLKFNGVQLHIFLFPGKLLCLTESSGFIQTCIIEKQPITPSTSGSHYSVSRLTEEENKPWISVRNMQHFLKKTQMWLRTHSTRYSEILAGRTDTCYFWQTDRKVTIKNENNSFMWGHIFLTETRSRLESRETCLN